MNTHPRIRSLLSSTEQKLFDKLNSPTRIQDFLNAIQTNFETTGETCLSPREVLKQKRAHCLEGALFAGSVLWYHGKNPLLLDLKASGDDYDHVIALFKEHGHWGAISKTNHAVLRYREPVYKTTRELALSYFHEYFNDKGVKTLRSFSKPFSLKKFGYRWITSNENLWDIGAALDDAPHMAIVPKKHIRHLRKADVLEIKAGKLTQHNQNDHKKV